MKDEKDYPSEAVRAFAPRNREPKVDMPKTEPMWPLKEPKPYVSDEASKGEAGQVQPVGLGAAFDTVHPPQVAMKADAGKPGFEFLPMDALGAINDVLRFGAKKYAPHNWEKGFAWTRLGNAILRHTFAWLSGELNDPETGLPHLAHAGCMLIFALSHQIRGIGTNDIATSQTANRKE